MRIVPAAPVLVEGVGASLPGNIAEVRRRALAALSSLPSADVVIVVAAGPSGTVFTGPIEASLAGLGAPGVTVQAKGHERAGDAIADAAGYRAADGRQLPIDHAALTLLLAQAQAVDAAVEQRAVDAAVEQRAAADAVERRAARGAPAPTVTAIAVPAGARFEELTAVGGAIARVLAAEQLRAAVVAAGDLSAALTPSAPVFLPDGSHDWDARALAALRDGLGGLRALGPEPAGRVGARGWAPLAVAHGLLTASGRSLSSPWYAAPCGVGYAVASDG